MGKTMAKITQLFATRWGIILVGAIIGILATLLQKLGNPANMGVCVACFERDIAGALGFTELPWFNICGPKSSVLSWVL